jgi:hypothetical protein
MTRQAQDTKQHGPHRLYNPRTIFNRSCCLRLNNSTKKIQTGQKWIWSLFLPLPISGSSRRVVGPFGVLVYVKNQLMGIQGSFPSRCTTILRPFLLPLLDLFTKRIRIVSFFLSIRLNDHLFYCSWSYFLRYRVALPITQLSFRWKYSIAQYSSVFKRGIRLLWLKQMITMKMTACKWNVCQQLLYNHVTWTAIFILIWF